MLNSFMKNLESNLEKNVEKLKTVLFQKNMGSIFEKFKKSKKIAEYILKKIGKETLNESFKSYSFIKS